MCNVDTARQQRCQEHTSYQVQYSIYEEVAEQTEIEYFEVCIEIFNDQSQASSILAMPVLLDILPVVGSLSDTEVMIVRFCHAQLLGRYSSLVEED